MENPQPQKFLGPQLAKQIIQRYVQKLGNNRHKHKAEYQARN